MSSLSPKSVYDALTNAGASTNQALGIMANMMNESGFNPEAIGDGGTSYGLVQNHGNYSYLVTGNPQADLLAQVNLLKQSGAFALASGNTPAEAAGNFAANYEKCVGCQAGGTQYNSRVANAATVQGWFNSGKWPASGSSGNSGGSSGNSGSSTTTLTSWTPLPGGLLDPLNWGPAIAGAAAQGILGPAESAASSIMGRVKADLWSAVKPGLIKLGLILLGGFIVIVGINGLLKSEHGPAELVTEGAKKIPEAAKEVPVE